MSEPIIQICRARACIAAEEVSYSPCEESLASQSEASCDLVDGEAEKLCLLKLPRTVTVRAVKVCNPGLRCHRSPSHVQLCVQQAIDVLRRGSSVAAAVLNVVHCTNS